MSDQSGMTPMTSAATDERPDPSVPPISWCRIFQVGPICPHLCGDCATTYRRKREMERTS